MDAGHPNRRVSLWFQRFGSITLAPEKMSLDGGHWRSISTTVPLSEDCVIYSETPMNCFKSATD